MPRRPGIVRLLTMSLAVLIWLAACGDSGTTVPTVGTTAAPTSTAPSTTPVASTTAPTLPTTTVPVEEWDLVWISDSLGSGGVPEAYAALIEEDLGVSVRVHDLWTGGLSAKFLLETLQGKNDGVLRPSEHAPVDLLELIPEAEVIVIIGNPGGIEIGDWNCQDHALAVGEQCGVTTDICGPEAWAPYEAILGEIYDTVFELRGGEPVIMRSPNWYIPWGALDSWRTCDREVVCKRCWGEFSAAIHRAAAAHGVPVADQLVAMNGENLDQEMPREYISDDVHPSAAGAAALAQVFADLGYELVYPVP